MNMPEKYKNYTVRGVEGGVQTGGWFLVISTGLNFLRDIVPATFPESGIIFIGALLAMLAGGVTAGTVSTSKRKKEKKQ